MINNHLNLNSTPISISSSRITTEPVIKTPQVQAESKNESLKSNQNKTEAKLNDQQSKELNKEQRDKIKKEINAIFEGLNTGLVLKYYDKSGEWYAVIENKLTREVVKEVPPKYMLDLQAKLKEMIGVFLDKKI